MKKYLLFDLDGTLADTGEGVMKAASFALAGLGINETNCLSLRRFIGPPLSESFRRFYGLDDERVKRGIELFHQSYDDSGIHLCSVYPGMPDLLASLPERTLCVSTSKPLDRAEEVLRFIGIRQYFQLVVGAEADESSYPSTKEDVIKETLRHLNNPPAGQVLMIGDRSYDIIGAHRCGIECLGVKFGYCDKDELELAGVDYTAKSVDELKIILHTKL